MYGRGSVKYTLAGSKVWGVHGIQAHSAWRSSDPKAIRSPSSADWLRTLADELEEHGRINKGSNPCYNMVVDSEGEEMVVDSEGEETCVKVGEYHWL